MFPKIPTNPGVYKDDTPLEAEGYFIDADKIRFVRGLPQSFGGWELVTSTTLTGKCRGVHTWADTRTIKWAAFGTHTNLYGLTDAVVYDATPIIERGQLTNPFSTTISSTSVSVADTSHGRAIGDGVNFSGASAVGGLTISGSYTVTSVTDANTYVITASSAATSTAGPGGGTVNYKYYLAIGLADSIGALGYGVGLYSTGTYSTVGTGDVFCRTWALCNFGPNLLACPRGGKIWEWHPATSASELVTNGSFAVDANWTKGTGISISGGQALFSTATSGLTQTILCEPMSYFVVEADATRSAGSLQISLNSVNVGSAISATANIQQTVYPGNAGGSYTLAFTGTGFTGTVDNVSVKQMLTAEAMTNAPTQNTCIVVTPDNFVMACGTIEVNTGNFNPMHIRWSDIAPNHHTWTPAATNLSRNWTLGIGSRIVAAKICGNEILIWTDKTLYAAGYVNNSNVVYNFRAIEGAAGLIGANAATVLGGVAYWKTPDGVNYRYSGGVAQAMQSTIQRDVFDNIAFGQVDKIFAAPIHQWQNVIWLYPDKRDGTNEVSRYELLCAQEPAPRQGNASLGMGVWAPGTFQRTAWVDASEGVFQYPIAVSNSGSVFYQEKGDTANGGNLTWSKTLGGIKMGDGKTIWMMSEFYPDFESLIGGCTMTPYSYLLPQSPSVTHGPFNITSSTTKIGLLTDAPAGTIVVLKFDGDAAPCFMRGGAHRMNAVDTGMST